MNSTRLSGSRVLGYRISLIWNWITGLLVLLSVTSLQAATDFAALMSAVRNDKIGELQAQLAKGGESSKADLRRYVQIILPAVARAGTPAILSLIVDTIGREEIRPALDTALVAAIENPKSTAMAEILLKLGANPSASAMGRTALARAAFIHSRRNENHALKTAQLLIDRGAKIEVSEDSGITPMMWACSSDDIPLVKLLLERGADPYRQNAEGRSARLLAGTGCLAVIKPKEPSNFTLKVIEVEQDPLTQALYQSVVTGDLEDTAELLRQGVSANAAINSSGKSVLMLTKDLPMFNLLLEHDANPNWIDAKGWTLLQRLVTCPGNLEFITALLAKKVNTQIRIDNGQNPLLLTHILFVDKLDAKSGREILRLLVEAGSDINSNDQDGETLLHLAAYNGAADLAQIAMDLGADPEQPNMRGETPLNLAERLQAKAVLEVLKRRPCAKTGC